MRLNEIKSDTVFDDLIKLGLVDVTDTGMSYLERKFTADHKPEDIHKILLKHDFEMNTHYKRGGPDLMPKYISYEHRNFGGGRVELKHRNGKVFYVIFDFRVSHD